MKKRVLITLCVIFALVVGMCVGTVAAGALETISAYLTYDVTVKLDGQTQTMYDANGKRVYPINYQGTTYLPVRAVSNMLGIDAEWDNATRTVLLGKTGIAKDFINDLEPYASRYPYYNTVITSDRFEPATIAGESYDHYIYFATTDILYYDLGGKYETLTFRAYTDLGYDDFEPIIQLLGDNGTILETVKVTPYDLFVEATVDVSGVTQLVMRSNGYDSISGVLPIYIFDATIE